MPTSLGNMPEADLIALGHQIIDQVGGSESDYGAVAAQITNLTTLTGSFQTAVTAQITAHNTELSATAFKNTQRIPLEAAIAKIRDQAKAFGTSDALMALLGLPSSTVSRPSTATVPVATVDTSARLQHTINFADAASPDNKRKPRGTVGCEIWRKIDGPPPTDVSECSFVALDTSTPYVAHYTGENAGKMVHYMLRWAMTDGSELPFGDTVSATITG